MYLRVLHSLIFVSLICSGCNTHKQETNQIRRPRQAITVQSLKRSLFDSLTKHAILTNVLKQDDSAYSTCFLTHVDNKKIIVIAITDSVIFLFQNENNKWVQTDSIPFDNYADDFNVTDLNGDGHDDLVITEAGDVHGMAHTDIFLNKNGSLHYMPDIHLYNIAYDSNTKLVSSFYYGAMYNNCKEYYRWLGDSLVLVRGAEQNAGSNGPDYVTFYRLKNGKRFDYKEVDDSSGAVFDTALWKDDAR